LRSNALLIRRLEFATCHFQIVATLQVHPEFRALAEYKPNRSAVSAVMRRRLFDDLGNAVRRNPNGFRKLILRQAVFGEKFRFQHFRRA
jgi:hypothetical protein